MHQGFAKKRKGGKNKKGNKAGPQCDPAAFNCGNTLRDRRKNRRQGDRVDNHEERSKGCYDKG